MAVMIEIMFSEGAAGSIQVAKSVNTIPVCSTSVILRNPDGSFPTPEELARYQAQVEEDCRIMWQSSIYMEGNSSDVVCFPLSLSIGDILDPFSDERAAFLQSLVMIAGDAFSGVGRELMDTARNGLEKVRNAVEAGEPVRIWTSHNPDELCGFCHILTLLPQSADVRVVELPEYEVLEKELRTYSGWGDIEPMELGRFQALERPLPDIERRYFARLWKALQAENGPLRAVVNGMLCTVEADFYDWLILRELENQPEVFHEARLIGKILGTHPLGLGDFQIARRMEVFISRGMLTPITEPEPNHPIYHRFLRKAHRS